MKIDITRFKPCDNGLNYYKSKPDSLSAWNGCTRSDWMLWAACKLNIKKDLIRFTAAKCAETVIHLMKDSRSRTAVNRIINSGGLYNKYANAAAADATYTTAVTADATYTTAVTAAAAAANAAAYSAAYSAAVAVACADAAAAARRENQLLTANICRKYLTNAIKEKISTFK